MLNIINELWASIQILNLFVSGLIFYLIGEIFSFATEDNSPQIKSPLEEKENPKILQIRDIISREESNTRSNTLEEIRKVVAISE